ncbi:MULTISPECIES: hypothetical protein [Bradyrhizobium]|uniref:hypothetical protein n=1 Tax=Bradyrhizobium TaxID=374 RepID=UPI000231DB64|nr:hypothetical protein [Bradyrhizobium japonicum]AJA65497.1 hypothetical protein RN69_38380 [Bradyrhizobium japonicum]KMK00045.1 hypothetical protein CF64_05180 [Bradyrhizobium japonicum]MCS3537379.1 NADPH-dependent curcumin reductase CurA [Bradyrhizobium japonicum]MCS3986534.1 NADPH-dependent curcumin reductase CurA [Bradyrhizobium japonicum]MCS4018652.1 NADPH-dependent curcumin reductase CurA [Bradyrhizobium japonicum]
MRPEFKTQVGEGLHSGDLVPKQTVVDGLELAADAFIGVLSGANIRKMLVRLADASSDMKRRSGLVNR